MKIDCVVTENEIDIVYVNRNIMEQFWHKALTYTYEYPTRYIHNVVEIDLGALITIKGAQN